MGSFLESIEFFVKRPHFEFRGFEELILIGMQRFGSHSFKRLEDFLLEHFGGFLLGRCNCFLLCFLAFQLALRNIPLTDGL